MPIECAMPPNLKGFAFLSPLGVVVSPVQLADPSHPKPTSSAVLFLVCYSADTMRPGLSRPRVIVLGGVHRHALGFYIFMKQRQNMKVLASHTDLNLAPGKDKPMNAMMPASLCSAEQVSSCLLVAKHFSPTDLYSFRGH